MPGRSDSKIIFLDRDGVINRFPGMGSYVVSWKDFRFLPNAKKAISHLTKAGFEINIVSNQGCVSRGLLTSQELDALTEKMVLAAKRAGGEIRGVFYCVHQKKDGCVCKKPKTKLFKDAIGKREVNLKSVYFIGDSKEDLEAGRRLGCRTILVLSGRIQKRQIKDLPVQPHFVKKNLWEAVRWILK